MFGNECLGELGYEATTSAIVMAGLFLSFLVDFIGHRVVLSKTQSASNGSAEDKSKSALTTEVISILVMEAGILFHSLRKLIQGLTRSGTDCLANLSQHSHRLDTSSCWR